MATPKWWVATYVVVAALHLLPVWRVDYVPTTDGPSHLYNAQVLHELARGTEEFERVFRADLSPHPNWLTYILLWLALFIVPPLVAEKLVVSVIFLTFLGGLWAISGAIASRNRVYAFLAMPLTFHALQQMGFYNYSIGAALVMFAVASWWKRRGRSDGWSIAATASWLVLCYFAHAVPAAVAILLCGAIWLISAARRGWRGRWPQLLAFFPAGGLLAWFFSRPTLPGGDFTWNGAFQWQPLARLGLLVTFEGRQLTFSTLLGVFLGCLIVVTLLVENVDWRRRRLVFSERDTFLLLTLIAAAIHLAAPVSVQEGTILELRLLIFPYLLLIGWLTPKLARVPVVGLFALVAALNVFYVLDMWKRNEKPFDQAVAVFATAETQRVVVPLVFDASAPRSGMSLLAHAASYGATTRRLIDLGNYEAALGFFPVAFREGVARPSIYELEASPSSYDPTRWSEVVDYVYTFRMPPGAPLEERLGARYDLVARSGEARLYRRR